MDIHVKNFAPDADIIMLYVDDEWRINIERDEVGTVSVFVHDLKEGSETRLILGQEDETQRL